MARPNYIKSKYDSFESTKDDGILKIFEYSAMRYNAKVFLVDNLMMAQYLGDEYYRTQSNFVGKLVEFSHKFDTHVHIVAHPIKTYGGIITKEDIRGSGDITNRADNVFKVSRVDKKAASEELSNANTAVEVLKNRFSGRQDIVIGLSFDPISKRFPMASDLSGLYFKCGWEKKEEST